LSVPLFIIRSNPIECSVCIARDRAQQGGMVDRFGHVVVHTLFKITIPITCHSIGCQSNDGNIAKRPRQRPYLSCCLKAVHNGHLNIHQDEIELARLDCFDGLATVVHECYVMTSGLQIEVDDHTVRCWQSNTNLSPLRAERADQSGDDVKPISFKRHRFPSAVILQAVRLYFRFTLSTRDVEELMAERGVEVSREAIRRWVIKFGPLIASNLRRGRSAPTGRWHLDEVVAKIGGRRMFIWRAVDDEGVLAV